MTTSTGPQILDWSVVAANWNRHRDHVEAMKRELTDALLVGLALAPGDRVLELGAGTGALAARLAGSVRPGGTVLASDVAPGMVESIRTNTVTIPEVQAAPIDAYDIPLADGSVDVVVFRMGLMLLTEPARALAECRRVLAPGGRLAVAVWGPPQANPWLTVVGISAMMQGLFPSGPPSGPGSPFSLADPDDLQRLVTEAGFATVEVRTIDGIAPFATTDEHFDTVRYLAPPIAVALSAAPADAVVRVRASAAGMLEPYRTAAGLAVPSQSLLCLATGAHVTRGEGA